MLVGVDVVHDGAAVADHHDVEGSHHRDGVEGVAQRNVEVFPQLPGQGDVLVAVTPATCLVGEVGHEQDARACGHADQYG